MATAAAMATGTGTATETEAAGAAATERAMAGAEVRAEAEDASRRKAARTFIAPILSQIGKSVGLTPVLPSLLAGPQGRRTSVLRREMSAQGGRVVDMAGDSVLALFESAAGAVDAALAVQKALEAASRATAAERRLRVRIGVHLGDVIEKADGSIYGHGVNVAAHLQTKAAPGGVCMSEALYESVKERLPGAARFAGRQRLKNIEDPVALWQVLPEGAGVARTA